MRQIVVKINGKYDDKVLKWSRSNMGYHFHYSSQIYISKGIAFRSNEEGYQPVKWMVEESLRDHGIFNYYVTEEEMI